MTCTLILNDPSATRTARRPLAHSVVQSALLTVALIGSLAPAARAQSFAPASLANTILHGQVTAGTGTLPTSGTFSQLFTADTDYNIALDGGAPSEPESYVYTAVDADSATIVEAHVNVALEFTSATGGTFATTFMAGGTQSGTFTLEPLAKPLVNISTRTKITAGANAIAGFVVYGDQPTSLLIRVVGPELARFDVPGTLADPKFTVFSGNTPIAENDNWDADTQNGDRVREAQAATGAFTLTDGSADAALVIDLQPGAYTVVGAAVNSAAEGEILIEAFLIR